MDCLRELFYGSTMNCLILKVARLAHQTFTLASGGPKDRKQFLESFNKLKSLVHQVGKTDVSLQTGLTSEASNSLWTHQSKDAPISYIEIFENDIFTLGIFVLKPGTRIPLHDHPGMYGIIKVLHGTVSVQSYSRVLNAIQPEGNRDSSVVDGLPEAFAVKKLPLLMANENSEPCCLTPDEANFHEVKSVGGNAAFLDILAPPYNYPVRKCHYFKEFGLDRQQELVVNPPQESCEDAHTFLIEVPQPCDYWSNSEPYLGPEVDF